MGNNTLTYFGAPSQVVQPMGGGGGGAHGNFSLLSSTDNNAKMIGKKGGFANITPYNLRQVIVLPKVRDASAVPLEKQTPAVSTELKVNLYYNSFMREHFLFEETTVKEDATTFEISSKLKQRLQTRQKFNHSMVTTCRTPFIGKEVAQSQAENGYQDAGQRSNRLAEMKIAQKFLRKQEELPKEDETHSYIGRGTSLALDLKSKRHSGIATAPMSPNAVTEQESRFKSTSNQEVRAPTGVPALDNNQTFYMFEANDYMQQKGLGGFKMSKKENAIERGQLLYDATKVTQMTQLYIQKNMKDIKRTRQLKESYASKMEVDAQVSQQSGKHEKYDPDAKFPPYLQDRRHELYNPLKENRITFTDRMVIEKMKKFGKWDYARDGTGYEPNEHGVLRKMDSLVESVYNSEKNLEWMNECGKPHNDPHQSEQSDTDYNLFDSDEDEERKSFSNEDSPTKKAEDPNQLLQQSPDPTGARAESSLTTGTQNISAGGSMSIADSNQFAQTKDQSSLEKKDGQDVEDPNDYFDAINIDGIQLASIKHLGPYKVIGKSRDQSKKLFRDRGLKEPSHEILEKIYHNYCTQIHAVPVRFLQFYKDGWLRLVNFNLQANMCIAIACVIPYMTDLVGVRFKNNGMRDDEASLMMRACAYCPKFGSFFMERNEVGEKFAYLLQLGFNSLQEQFVELSLAQCKNFMKISSKVCQMAVNGYLNHLDLSNTVMNFLASKLLANLIRQTSRLQNLNLSNCTLRGTSAREITNALLFNQSLKFLNLSVNSFASRDYDLSSKLARMIQIHSSLVHLDLTSISIRREEAMYIGQCLKDSSNIVSCHLTGNSIDYYSRLFLRAQLNATVQFPMINSHHNQTTIMSTDRAQILALNNQIQLGISEDVGGKLSAMKKENSEYFDDVLPEYTEKDQLRFKQIAEDESPLKGRRQFRESTFSAEDNQDASQEGQQKLGTPSQMRKVSLQQVSDNLKHQQSKVSNSQPSKEASGRASQNNGSSRTIGFQSPQKTPGFTSGQRSITHESQNNEDNHDNGQGKLKKYLKDGQSRIYDMLHMLDIYGNKKKVEDAKNDFKVAFPQSDIGKALIQEKHKRKLNLNKLVGGGGGGGHNDIILINETPRITTRDEQTGTISEQNDMARFIATLVTNFDEKNLQNPMNGFLKELIFTRYLGHDNVDNHEVWRDCSQCWICERWDKAKVQFYNPDVIHDTQFQKIFEISQTFNQMTGGAGETMLKTIVELDSEDEQERIRLLALKDLNKQASKDDLSFEFAEYLQTSKAEQNPPLPLKTNDQASKKSNLGSNSTSSSIVVANKVLYSNHISTVRLDKARLQGQMVPTMSQLYKDEIDPQLVMHNNCVPYKPFTKKAHAKALQSQTCTPVEIQKINAVSLVSSPQKSPIKQTRKSHKKVRDPITHDQGGQEQENSEEEWSEESYDSSEDGLRISKTEEAKMKIQIKDIFTEWWKILPEVTASGGQVEDIYLIASFNNWIPVKMEAWEKKLALIKDRQEISRQTEKIRAQLKQIELPQAIVKDHIARKYAHLTRNESNENALLTGNQDSSSSGDLPSYDQAVPELFKTIEGKEEEKKYETGVIKTDVAYNYTKFLPSGKHFFYFIRQGKYFSLSDRYPVKKFKGTNLYMNEIHVAPKTWKMSDFEIGEIHGIKSKLKFDVSRSIFKTFKVENEELLRKVFELDMKYTKIKKVFKNNHSECEIITNLLWKNFEKIKNIFLTCIINSEYPVVSWNDFTILCNRCKIPDKVCNLSTIDRIYIATNVNQNTSGAQGDKDLVRYEFLEIIVRIANAKYKDQMYCATSSEALKRLLDENIFPNLEESIQKHFRENVLYTEEVNDILTRNEVGLKKLFGLYTHGQKRYMTVKDSVDLINLKSEMRFLEKQVIKQYGLSKMIHVDAINNPEFPYRMVFVEFLEFIGRIAFEVFKDHEKMKNEPLHLKIDALLTKMFKVVKFQKAFTFLEGSRQNVIYEVVLNPQLGQTAEYNGSQERAEEDIILTPNVKLNL